MLLSNFISDGKFVKPNKIDVSKTEFLTDLKDSLSIKARALELEGWQFLRFTGRVDRNGVKIYEGDLVKYHVRFHEFEEAETHIGEVYYDDHVCCFLFDRSFEMSFLDLTVAFDQMEVVGSIYTQEQE